MYCNVLLNLLQNVVVPSTFIAVLAFLTGGSFTISILQSDLSSSKIYLAGKRFTTKNIKINLTCKLSKKYISRKGRRRFG